MCATRSDAMAFFKPPFMYEFGYIFDSERSVVAADLDTENLSGSELVEEIGNMVADALNAYYAANPVKRC